MAIFPCEPELASWLLDFHSAVKPIASNCTIAVKYNIINDFRFILFYFILFCMYSHTCNKDTLQLGKWGMAYVQTLLWQCSAVYHKYFT